MPRPIQSDKLARGLGVKLITALRLWWPVNARLQLLIEADAMHRQQGRVLRELAQRHELALARLEQLNETLAARLQIQAQQLRALDAKLAQQEAEQASQARVIPSHLVH